MHIIGLCGQSGSGKSTVADYFSSFGVPVLDADKIYRELTDAPSACLDAIQQAFGEQAVTDSGALNRVFLREVVFASEDASEKRALLNQRGSSRGGLLFLRRVESRQFCLMYRFFLNPALINYAIF